MNCVADQNTQCKGFQIAYSGNDDLKKVNRQYYDLAAQIYNLAKDEGGPDDSSCQHHFFETAGLCAATASKNQDMKNLSKASDKIGQNLKAIANSSMQFRQSIEDANNKVTVQQLSLADAGGSLGPYCIFPSAPNVWGEYPSGQSVLELAATTPSNSNSHQQSPAPIDADPRAAPDAVAPGGIRPAKVVSGTPPLPTPTSPKPADSSKPAPVSGDHKSGVPSWLLPAAVGAGGMFVLDRTLLKPKAKTDTVTVTSNAPLASATGTVATSSLSFSATPSGGVVGQPLSPLQVTIKNAAGNIDSSNNSTQVTISCMLPANCAIAGTVTVTAVNGVANFNALNAQGAYSGMFLKASANGFPDTSSGSITISAP